MTSAFEVTHNPCHQGYDAISQTELGQSMELPTTCTGWRKSIDEVSMPEIYRTVEIPGFDAQWWKKLFAYCGPGAIVAVGYMDPGNWSTDIGGGSAYQYDLLLVILLSSFVAIFLQALAVKLGM